MNVEKTQNSKIEGKYIRKVDIGLEHAYRGYINNKNRNHWLTENKRFHFFFFFEKKIDTLISIKIKISTTK